MSTQLARPHDHLSNRAKIRSALDRKPVFKSVLQNPFQLSWPSVPAAVQNDLLARLVASLENVPLRAHAARRRAVASSVNVHADVEISSPMPDRNSGISPTLLVGINTVTRALESQLDALRKHVVLNNTVQNHVESPSPITIVFVCYADVDPPALVGHIPYLVAGCNSPKNVRRPIKLVPLPKGSEPTIASILGVRNAAVVAFRPESPLCEAVGDILDAVPIVSASWLCPPDAQTTSQLVPTHIKQLHTTAPRDMKAARQERSKARAAAKKSSKPVRRKHRLKLTTESKREERAVDI